jgi:hypothetical protein
MSPHGNRFAGRTVCLCALALSLSAASPPARAETELDCAPPPAASLTVNVKDKGAKGDGRTDDTAAIQAAIDQVGGTKGTVFVPDGTYMVDTDKKHRLKLKSDMTLKLAPGAALKAFPTDEEKYSMLEIMGVSDVVVTGGTLEGERDAHQGKSGQWGMGIFIGKDAERITIAKVTATKMWGDGFYIGGAKDVSFCAVTADYNRRQGLSIVDADGVLILGSVFKNTRGTEPGAGIDFEPDDESDQVINVRVEKSKFIDNAGGGIRVAGRKSHISKMSMTGNLFKGNRPFVVVNAPGVAASICGNRQTTVQNDASGGFNAYAEPIDIVSLQETCGETSFVLDRQVSKKKKKKQRDD